jgi:hypothetical protein
MSNNPTKPPTLAPTPAPAHTHMPLSGSTQKRPIKDLLSFSSFAPEQPTQHPPPTPSQAPAATPKPVRPGARPLIVPSASVPKPATPTNPPPQTPGWARALTSSSVGAAVPAATAVLCSKITKPLPARILETSHRRGVVYRSDARGGFAGDGEAKERK